MARKGKRWARPAAMRRGNAPDSPRPAAVSCAVQNPCARSPETGQPNPAGILLGKRLGLLTLLVLGAGILWASWPTLLDMSERWSDDPQYSHGYLVPVFAGVLLWLRRDCLPQGGFRLSGWGILLLLAGAGLRLAGVYLYLNWLEGISLLPTLAGLAVLLGGRPALRWAGPAFAFLFFMVPLPYRLQTALAYPLQRLVTEASTFALQTLGLPALAEGNIILLNDVRLGVVEACSGLTMMMTFFALATAVALVIKRPALDRAVIVLSAAPIALLANVVRITLTGVLYEVVDAELVHAFFHDWAGWLMMPVALGLLALVLKILSCLLVVPRPKDEALLNMFRMTAAPPPSPRQEAAAAPTGLSGVV
jgi:exosortase